MSQTKPLRVVFIVAHDAYLKGARNICAILEKQIRAEVFWLTTSKRLVLQGVGWLDMAQVGQNRVLSHADLVFAGLGGRNLNRLIHSLKGSSTSRNVGRQPRIIGYFPGVLHLRIFESMATRLLCDRVLLNSPRDYSLYRRLAEAALGYNNGVLFGAPWISPAPVNSPAPDIDLLFVEQSVVPQTRGDRTRLVMLLAELARQHPDRRIVIALRARKGEASSHQLEHCLEDISRQIDSGSLRLEFVQENIDGLVARACRVATISSSVAFTSLAWGKPTLFVSDLGIKQCWGNDLFRGSGYMASLREVYRHDACVTRWCGEYVLQPRPDVIAALERTPLLDNGRVMNGSAGKGRAIPGIHAMNLSLLWLILMFCIKSMKQPLAEFVCLRRTIRNINNRVYGKSLDCDSANNFASIDASVDNNVLDG